MEETVYFTKFIKLTKKLIPTNSLSFVGIHTLEIIHSVYENSLANQEKEAIFKFKCFKK